MTVHVLATSQLSLRRVSAFRESGLTLRAAQLLVSALDAYAKLTPSTCYAKRVALICRHTGWDPETAGCVLMQLKYVTPRRKCARPGCSATVPVGGYCSDACFARLVRILALDAVKAAGETT